MINKKVQKDFSFINFKSKALVWVLVIPCILFSADVMAVFDLEAGVRAATEPAKKIINDYYHVGIFITGAMGALLHQQGDLRDRMLGFGKGAMVGGLVVLAVKAGLGV